MADGGGSVSHMVPAGTPHASGDIDIPPPFVPSQNNTEPGAPSALGIDIHHQPHIQNQHMPDLSGTTASSPVTPVPVLVPMPARASAPNFLPDFPSHNTLGNSSFPLHSQTHSLHQGIHSQAASPPSNATSPSGAHTSYTSSLASALHPPSSATDSGYDDPGFMFPPAEYSMGNATGAGLAVDGLKEGSGSPETGGDAHLYIMGTMLTNAISVAESARAACEVGETTQAGLKISELKKTADLLQTLMAAMNIVDNPAPPSQTHPLADSHPQASMPPSTRNSPSHPHQLSHPHTVSQFPPSDLGVNLNLNLDAMVGVQGTGPGNVPNTLLDGRQGGMLEVQSSALENMLNPNAVNSMLDRNAPNPMLDPNGVNAMLDPNGPNSILDPNAVNPMLDIQGSGPASPPEGSTESSRKRCASSIATGDRVNKAIKLEPALEDPPLFSPVEHIETHGGSHRQSPVRRESYNGVLQHQQHEIELEMEREMHRQNRQFEQAMQDHQAFQQEQAFAQEQHAFAQEHRPVHHLPHSQHHSPQHQMHASQQQQHSPPPPFVHAHSHNPPHSAPMTFSPSDPLSSIASSSNITSPPHTSPPPFPTRATWSDATTFPTTRQLGGPLSSQFSSEANSPDPNGGAGGVNPKNIGMLAGTMPPFTAAGQFSTPPTVPSQNGITSSGGAPLGRVSRSGSFTRANGFSGYGMEIGLDHYDYRGRVASSSVSSSTMAPSTAPVSPAEISSDDEDDDGYNGYTGGDSRGRSGSGVGGGVGGGMTVRGHGNEVPIEYKAEVDRVFFEFLTRVCSNLDATDAKGEPIHQTLMAKKMQRLDESPDFRPFKFRIQAFTNAFLEELAKQGYPEEKIPMKKIRNYLWAQPYISRFNEDGKKAKSKGNHIWNIDAKKTPDGGWLFRPFQRRIAGSPPGIAYTGLRWTWAPRIWDPWGARPDQQVIYSSPGLPEWLTWSDDTLSGTPPPEADSCDITVDAQFTVEGQDEHLTTTFHLNIAPVSALDVILPLSRRPSINGDNRRVQSDSVVHQVSGTSLRPIMRAAPQPPPPLLPAQTPSARKSQSPPMPVHGDHEQQVIEVLQAAAERVAAEAQSQIIASPESQDPSLQKLAKQQHVLTVTVKAFGDDAAQRPDGTQTSTALAVAGSQVVFQAARTVAADRSATLPNIPGVAPSAQQVTVNDVSVATQSAVAQAVNNLGTLSTEVNILMAATELLENRTPPPVSLSTGASFDASQLGPALEPTRPHSTGNMIPDPFLAATASIADSAPFPPSSNLLPAMFSDYSHS